MPPHVAFFWGTVLFLLGVLLKSFFSGTVVLITTVFLFLSLVFIFKKLKISLVFSLLVFLLLLGSFYYHFYDTLTRPQTLPYGEEIVVRGKVIQADSRMAVQMLTVRATEPFRGKVRTVMDPVPTMKYGDEVELTGTLERPEEPYVNYLKKDNIFSEMSFPKAKRVNSKLWTTRGTLYGVSNAVQSAFSRIFPAREAALMSGIVIGDTSQFTKEFKEAMQRTGTTHIVALSGYNVMIIVSACFALLGYFMRRRTARWVAFPIILLFILMTGGDASVVRAAVMAFLAMYLTVEGRMRDPGNIVAATALAMVLWNPRVLAYDVGFQLSFLAFIGLVYISPHIILHLKHREQKRAGFFKEPFAYTVSAQMMTFPLLIGYFDRFFVSSIVPNVLVVALVPLTMALGFISALLSFVFPALSYFAGWFAYPFLRLETFIIDFFSRIAFFQISFNVGVLFAAVYYALVFKFFFLPFSKNSRETSDTFSFK